MAKAPWNVMNPKVYEHAFCSPVQFTVRYKAIASWKKGERAINREGPGEERSESKNSERVELWPASEMENSAPRYICAAWKFLQTIAAKLAMRVSLVDISVHCWWSESL